MTNKPGNTDGAPIELVAAELIKCCEVWEPTTRILGNIRAEDIIRMCSSFIRDIKLNNIVDEHDTTISKRNQDLADGEKLFNGIIDGSILPEDIHKSGISEKAYSHTSSLLLNAVLLNNNVAEMMNGHTNVYLDINDINHAKECRKIIFNIITNLRKLQKSPERGV